VEAPDAYGPTRARGRCEIDRYQYLLLMAACLLVTLPLEFLLGARVYRRLRALLWALVPVVLIFAVWDIVGILRGHWTYSPRYVTGLQLGLGMPVEELVFFVVIPVCGLLSYEAVGSGLERLRRRRAPAADPGPRSAQPVGNPGA